MSGWSSAGFPVEFRFRNHYQVAHTLASAVLERSIAAGGNMEMTNDRIPLLTLKWDWYYWDYPLKKLFTTGLLSIASCFCEPEKAYDFENYPVLENWNPDSLQKRLGGDYLEYSPFVDKDKWAVFVYRVLNLCYVKRVPVRQDNPRPVFSGTRFRRVRTVPEKVLTELKNADFYYNDRENIGSSIQFVKYDNGSGMVTAIQSICGFSTAYNYKCPCDVTFYGCAVKGECDEFSTLGAADVNGDPVQENVWFCAGKPAEGDVFDLYARKTLDFPDSELPDALPQLEYDKVWKHGFELKKLDISTSSVTYNGYAVCDYYNHFKYQLKNGEQTR